MWNRGHSTSDLSISTTVQNSSSLRSPISTRKAASQIWGADSSPFEYSPTIPDDGPVQGPQIDKIATPFHLTKLILKHMVILLGVSVSVVLLALAAATPTWWNSTSYARSHSFNHCNYDGSFTPYDHRTVSLWDPKSFFLINLFWGNMTFSLAKFLDVGFDLVVGRGLQAVFAFVTYEVASKTLGKIMETTTISYQTFEALAFASPSLARTTNLLWELAFNRGLQSRLTIMLLILSSAFVLAFPTLTSAMAGYSNNLVPELTTRAGQNFSWNDVHVASFVIHDGQRLGTTEPYYIHGPAACIFQGPGRSFDTSSAGSVYRRDNKEDTDSENDEKDGAIWKAVPSKCLSFWRTVQYISGYGLDPSNFSTEFYLNGGETDLDPPTLNITTTFQPKAVEQLVNVVQKSLQGDSPSHAILASLDGAAIHPNSTFIFQHQTYSFEYVMSNTHCYATNSHNWGFSFLFLFISVLLMTLWALVMYILWLDAYFHSRIDKSGRDLGPYRASWDLVQAMKQDSSLGSVTDDMSDREIKTLVGGFRNFAHSAGHGGMTFQHRTSGVVSTRLEEFKRLWVGRRGKRGRTGDNDNNEKDAVAQLGGATSIWGASNPAYGDGSSFAPALIFRNKIDLSSEADVR